MPTRLGRQVEQHAIRQLTQKLNEHAGIVQAGRKVGSDRSVDEMCLSLGRDEQVRLVAGHGHRQGQGGIQIGIDEANAAAPIAGSQVVVKSTRWTALFLA